MGVVGGENRSEFTVGTRVQTRRPPGVEDVAPADRRTRFTVVGNEYLSRMNRADGLIRVSPGKRTEESEMLDETSGFRG